ncbi:unnamed protein product [Callosobruchus maculatus]|uniref:Cytochrome b-c1 complex subunit 8 n=1 Tax=Callosobruchus maculatus TaxID=64391 RepID=A0A653C850_CALMS|nr:unnamed protein product [Callosobruchus maculatus]
MGHHEPYIMRRIVTYAISQHHLKAWPKVQHVISRTIRRCSEQFLYIVPPLAIGFLVYTTANARHEHLQRKKPGDFDHED